jgi:hypothetical protein
MADVTEGSGGIWERLHYDWSDPNHVVLTTTDSNTWGGASGHTYSVLLLHGEYLVYGPGHDAEPLLRHSLPYCCTAVVSFSGIAPGNAGQYQINVAIPVGVAPGDSVPLTVKMPDGSADTVTIAITAS